MTLLYASPSSLSLLPIRQGSVQPYTLVEGPQAWFGKDYQDTFDEWAIRITPEHISELEAAIEGVLSKGVVQQEGNHLNLVRTPSCLGQHLTMDIWAVFAALNSAARFNHMAPPCVQAVLFPCHNMYAFYPALPWSLPTFPPKHTPAASSTCC